VESDRLLRLAEIFQFQGASDLFEGNTAAARKWLQSPEKGLGNVSPIDYAVTDIGACEVRNLIGRVEYGSSLDRGLESIQNKTP
jgi:putative toxin-antitoxin system antitoxin component (TIGR02293 family)